MAYKEIQLDIYIEKQLNLEAFATLFGPITPKHKLLNVENMPKMMLIKWLPYD